MLLDGFHVALKWGDMRPAAVNLIEGRLNEVIAFLDGLSYGPGSTPGMQEIRAEWMRRSENARGWGKIRNGG